MIRFVLAATSIIVAVLVLPFSLVPVFNTADLIVGATPFVVAGLYLAPRRDTPPGDDAGTN